MASILPARITSLQSSAIKYLQRLTEGHNSIRSWRKNSPLICSHNITCSTHYQKFFLHTCDRLPRLTCVLLPPTMGLQRLWGTAQTCLPSSVPRSSLSLCLHRHISSSTCLVSWLVPWTLHLHMGKLAFCLCVHMALLPLWRWLGIYMYVGGFSSCTNYPCRCAWAGTEMASARFGVDCEKWVFWAVMLWVSLVKLHN